MFASDSFFPNFDLAAHQWEFDRLVVDLADAKRTWASRRRKGLTKTEKEHLYGLLCGCSPEEIARRLHKCPSTVNEALSETIYRYVEILVGREANSLENWRDVTDWLERQGYKKGTFLPPQSENLEHIADLSGFVGRQEELARLERWIGREGKRLAGICGMGGIGKTNLAVKFARQSSDRFDFIIWRTLQAAPSLDDLLADLLQSTHGEERIESEIDRFVRFLRQYRCLIVLDDTENILSSGEYSGKYLESCCEFDKLFEQILKTIHESCLLLVGRELPRTIAMLESRHDRVSILPLQGLKTEDAYQLLEREKLADRESWARLIDLYRGNAASLKVIAQTIRNFYGGKVADFLKPNSIVVGDVSTLLEQHFNRLSLLEMQIAYWFALAREPLSVNTLKTLMRWQRSNAELLEAVVSLERRSLLEKKQKNEPFYTQQPVIMKYATNRFAKEVTQDIFECLEAQEIVSADLLLRRHRLLGARSQPELAAQYRLILSPIRNALLARYRRQQTLRVQLQQLLNVARGEDGYVVENLQAVMQSLDPPLEK